MSDVRNVWQNLGFETMIVIQLNHYIYPSPAAGTQSRPGAGGRLGWAGSGWETGASHI